MRGLFEKTLVNPSICQKDPGWPKLVSNQGFQEAGAYFVEFLYGVNGLVIESVGAALSSGVNADDA